MFANEPVKKGGGMGSQGVHIQCTSHYSAYKSSPACIIQCKYEKKGERFWQVFSLSERRHNTHVDALTRGWLCSRVCWGIDLPGTARPDVGLYVTSNNCDAENKTTNGRYTNRHLAHTHVCKNVSYREFTRFNPKRKQLLIIFLLNVL